MLAQCLAQRKGKEMTKKEIIREIEEEENRKAGEDPRTDFVVEAKIAIDVIQQLDIE